MTKWEDWSESEIQNRFIYPHQLLLIKLPKTGFYSRILFKPKFLKFTTTIIYTIYTLFLRGIQYNIFDTFLYHTQQFFFYYNLFFTVCIWNKWQVSMQFLWSSFVFYKGQKISEEKFWCLQFSQKKKRVVPSFLRSVKVHFNILIGAI